jgi:hypothetical protein
MLYKFKSDAGADVIMLEANGRQILEIIGKGPDAKGILLPEQMSAARAAIEAAIASEEAQNSQADQGDDDEDTHDAQAKKKHIGLRARAWPLVMLIEHSAKAKVPIVWGV